MKHRQKIFAALIMLVYSAVLIAATTLVVQNQPRNQLYAEVDKELVLYEALANNPKLSAEEFASTVEGPMLQFLNDWIDKGYLIYSVRSDLSGQKHLAVEAMPKSIDLTDQLQVVVNDAVAKANKVTAKPTTPAEQ